jgi:hypothetical protein
MDKKRFMIGLLDRYGRIGVRAPIRNGMRSPGRRGS